MQMAKPQQGARLFRQVVLGPLLLPFAICVLPFDLFFSAARSQNAKRKWQSHGGFYFCLLHFAFCLLTCSLSLTFAFCFVLSGLLLPFVFCDLPFDFLFRVVSTEA
jgi:hypothetical protein